MNETAIWFFEKTSKMDKSLTRLKKKSTKKTQLPISAVKQEIPLQTLQLAKGKKGYLQNNPKHIFDNLQKLDHFLQKTQTATSHSIGNRSSKSPAATFTHLGCIRSVLSMRRIVFVWEKERKGAFLLDSCDLDWLK